ncbi:MAG: hypothetical protein HQM14_15435 [SAR324 cluster bacterium]|nr:hypothetical protein [SAR324 cluster bacterium]
MKHYLNQFFYKGLCLLIFWRVKYQKFRIQKGNYPPKKHDILIFTSQPHTSLNPAIWENIQTRWNWQKYGFVVIKSIVPALPLNTKADALGTKVVKRFNYLWQKLKLAFVIVGEIDQCEGVILETLFSYKGELFLEELFLGCFQKTILDETHIQKEVQQLANDSKYEIDIPALEKKINKVGSYVGLRWNPILP